MTAKVFFDTNTLLYLVSSDLAKADRAQELLAAGGTISVQVLNELLNVCRRKFGSSWAQADTLLDLVREKCLVEPLTAGTHELGRRLAQRHQLSIYDAMIVAAALLAGCEMLYSEDLHHGLVIDQRLTVCNPFKSP